MTNTQDAYRAPVEADYRGTVPDARVVGSQRERLLERTRAYVESRRTLDPEPLIARLAPDVVYESQEHLDALRGREAVTEYLRGRYEFLRSLVGTRDLGTWRIAEIDLPSGTGTPCALFELDGVREACHVLTLDADGRVRRVDILTLAPRPDEARVIE